ncbi:MAG: response regulator transcription factor [Chloroflexi bacterium]|nr:response regulator transcription factor [Chloroflexota bacterium]
MPKTILIIEDETRIAHWVREYFEKAGFRALTAADGPSGLSMAQTEEPDLVILDLMLPGMDGTEVCHSIRRDSDVPIIMLTARGKESDRILGLELGADDYVVKPFSPGELVARARAVLRRANKEITQDETLTIDGIYLDLASYKCLVDEKPVKLSRIQFSILESFMRNIGRVFSRQQLLESAFDGDYSGYERTIDVHIRRLRKKIEKDPANPKYILTVFGLGYKFME